MPEGDTLHRLALRLRPVLLDATLEGANNREQGELDVVAGARVELIAAHGKNLVIGLSNGWSFRIHLGIAGKCDGYRTGSRWRRHRRLATLVIRTAEHEIVFFKAPKARLVRSAHLRATAGLVKLGPDLLGPQVDLEEILKRIRHPHNRRRPMGEALLDQRIAAGIGNVYKCELLFLEGIHPWRAVASVDDAGLAKLFRRARKLMVKNLRTTWRTTRFAAGSRHWVYGRTGEPCFRCRSIIESRRQGEDARNTYWCPRCQPDREVARNATTEATSATPPPCSS